MATAHQIRDLITQTTTGTVRPRVPREVRDAISRFVAGAPVDGRERLPLVTALNHQDVLKFDALGSLLSDGGCPCCLP